MLRCSMAKQLKTKTHREVAKAKTKAIAKEKARVKRGVLHKRELGWAMSRIAKEYKVSVPTVSRIIKENGPDGPASVEARAAKILARSAQAPTGTDTPPEDEPESYKGLDTYAFNKRMQLDMRRRADQANQDGNHTAGARYMSEATKMSLIIGREEKIAGDNDDVLRMSIPDIEETMLGVEQKIETLVAERPLLCSACNRALSIAYGTEGKKPPGEDVG